MPCNHSDQRHPEAGVVSRPHWVRMRDWMTHCVFGAKTALSSLSFTFSKLLSFSPSEPVCLILHLSALQHFLGKKRKKKILEVLLDSWGKVMFSDTTVRCQSILLTCQLPGFHTYSTLLFRCQGSEWLLYHFVAISIPEETVQTPLRWLMQWISQTPLC